MSLRRLCGTAALVLLVVALGVAAGCSTDDVVAKINGEEITRTEYNSLWGQVVLQLGEEPTGTTKTEYQQQLLQYMVESEVIKQDAVELGVDLSDEAIEEGFVSLVGSASTDPAVIADLESVGLTVEDARVSVIDELCRDYLYNQIAAETTTTTLPKTYTLLEHILVSSETTANALMAQIQAGADFNELATTYSEDYYSAIDGGNLGWAATTDWVAEFAAAAEALEVGEISGLVQSDYGYHIIRKVSEVTTGTPIADCPADVVSDVTSTTAYDAYYAYIEGLMAAADIEYLDSTLAPSTTTTE